MNQLPPELLSVIIGFQPLFTKPSWEYAKTLLCGALLTPGSRTVANCLRTIGLSDFPRFQNYHRFLSRSTWSSLKASQILLQILVSVFVPKGEILLGIDETIERRKGPKIKARGIYRDPVASSRSHFVKVSGLRWISCMLLTKVSFANKIWALPFFSTLAPSKGFYESLGRSHKKLTERAFQTILLISRWLPKRKITFVADSTYATYELFYKIGKLGNVSIITRMRLDAQLWKPPPPYNLKGRGRPRIIGERLPSPEEHLNSNSTRWVKAIVKNWYGEGKRELEIYSEKSIWYKTGFHPIPIRWVLIRDPKGKFETQALMSTNLKHTPLQIISWFARRWQMEVTFEEGRRHLGMETQRQWSDLAIERSTPLLLGMFSIVTLVAQKLVVVGKKQTQKSAWYDKKEATFSDALGMIRKELWEVVFFSTSMEKSDVLKIPKPLFSRIIEILCYPA